MTDEPLNPIERLRVHLTLEHHEEDADAFALVDSLIQSYALEYPDDLTADAQELQTLLLDVIESWTPARVCAGCGNEDAIDNGLCQACVDHQYTSSDALRARVAELEAAFNDQSRELEIACSIMTPDQLTEYRCRAYSNLYPLAT